MILSKSSIMVRVWFAILSFFLSNFQLGLCTSVHVHTAYIIGGYYVQIWTMQNNWINDISLTIALSYPAPWILSGLNTYRFEVYNLGSHELWSTKQYLQFFQGFEASGQSEIDYFNSIPSSVHAQYILGLKIKTRLYDDWLIDERLIDTLLD